MARETYWLRSAASFVDDVEREAHSVRLGIFAPGETVTRIRFSYFLSAYETANPILHDDVVICLGVDVSPFADAPSGFLPYTSPSHDWMWWEGETQGIQLYEPTGEARYITEERGPMDRSHRDVKAQRRNDGADYWSIWMHTQSTKGPLQGLHYLGYAASVLVLKAP